MNHATINRRVAALEAALGVRLVDRLARSTPLTEHGAAVAALAAGMEATALHIQRRARDASATLSGTVTVSAPPSLASLFIAPGLAALRQAHPALAISLSAVPGFASLDRGEADLAVRLSRPEQPDMIARPLGRLAFALYAAPAVAARPPAEWCFIGYDEILAQVPQQLWLEAYAAGRPVLFRTSDVFGQMRAAQAGLGVAVIPRFMADGDPALVRVDLDHAPPPRGIWLLTHADIRKTPAVRATADHLVALFADAGVFAGR